MKNDPTVYKKENRSTTLDWLLIYTSDSRTKSLLLIACSFYLQYLGNDEHYVLHYILGVMTSSMNKFLIDNFRISPHEAELFSSCFQVKAYSKGEKFIEYGKVSQKIGFVEKGLLKCVSIGNRKEVIDDFVFENQFVANYYSFLTKNESTKEIICMNDSVIRITTRNQIEELGKKHSFMEQMARNIAEKLFISTHQKLEDIRLLSAEERYLKLLNSNSNIMNEIPQYEIASYLNVSPETVSRIRKKLMKIS
ncbi:Crp/Fnr family transcriptional regulator [Fulvivirgaceae bacterium BMA10]|uniref:Crp/Fnr family transcriptional regulator n=1 Tax=Splendidivirga corallicola TaxID=3051826 RepID=A0ABT8KWM4_9BACT|nr:Crp/Fnr family transcriptional regulator [Fulvivirgaceae bacterium BMA10]